MNIFSLSDETDISDKINLDDLFEKKREIAENKLQLYNKILNRIHTKIKLTSNNNQGKEQFCWYLIPEMMIGISRYNVNECIGYILRKLRENEFVVRYTNPNLILISWQHWVPDYVRQEYKKQTGQTIDGFGNEQNNKEKNKQVESSDPNNLLLNSSDKSIKLDKSKNNDFNSVKNYKPSGIYNNDLLQKIQNKFEIK
jgi:hypothetical protein